MGQFTYYQQNVEEKARDLFKENIDSIIENLKEGSVDLYEFFDQPVHEWAENDFIYVDLRDAADILEQSDNVETDSGLWEGQEPRKAIETQAFFTYRNDLMLELKEVAEEELNEYKNTVEIAIEEMEGEREAIQDKLKDLEAELDELEDEEGREDEVQDLEDAYEAAENEYNAKGEKLEEWNDILDNIETTIEQFC